MTNPTRVESATPITRPRAVPDSPPAPSRGRPNLAEHTQTDRPIQDSLGRHRPGASSRICSMRAGQILWVNCTSAWGTKPTSAAQERTVGACPVTLTWPAAFFISVALICVLLAYLATIGPKGRP